MKFGIAKIMIGGGLALSMGVASAQSYNSFNPTSLIYGISVEKSGLSYTVSLDSGAYVTLTDGTHLDVEEVFGFWTLSKDVDLNASGEDQNGWGWNQKDANGHIAGWHDPDKHHDLHPGDSLTFTYDTLDEGAVEDYGFHLLYTQEWKGGNTAYFKGTPVPEPASILAMALGGGLILLRKRAKKA